MENPNHHCIEVIKKMGKDGEHLALELFSEDSSSKRPVLEVRPGHQIQIVLNKGVPKATIWFIPSTVYTRWFHKNRAYSPTTQAANTKSPKCTHLNIIGSEDDIVQTKPFLVADIPDVMTMRLSDNEFANLIEAIIASDPKVSSKWLPENVYNDLSKDGFGESTNAILMNSLASVRKALSADVFRSLPESTRMLFYDLEVTSSEDILPTSLGNGDGAAGKLNVSTG